MSVTVFCGDFVYHPKRFYINAFDGNTIKISADFIYCIGTVQNFHRRIVAINFSGMTREIVITFILCPIIQYSDVKYFE